MATATTEYHAKAYGASAPDSGVGPMQITPCGICHSDLHSARNDWGFTTYPIVPGHEIVGIVSAVGDRVIRHKVGDQVALGCMVDSCMECSHCKADL